MHMNDMAECNNMPFVRVYLKIEGVPIPCREEGLLYPFYGTLPLFEWLGPSSMVPTTTALAHQVFHVVRQINRSRMHHFQRNM